ncbi:hypothetical protein M6B38_394290 [Iris pallida]|uniref:Uncharacterized protein n=1 Tax=Iris pallida TaxID=29817 RepID=A0AAX6FWZ2_IRIPA|nr:hypothetical protein M6B38_394290 [Iris pallida]
MSIFTHLNSRSSRPQFFLSPNFDRNPNPKFEVAMATPRPSLSPASTPQVFLPGNRADQ